MAIKVQSNIKIPDMHVAGYHKRVVEYPFAIMKVGDSFQIKEGNIYNLSAAAHGWVKRNKKKWKFATRTTKDGARIWRIK